MKSVQVGSRVATNVERAVLREGLETMLFPRTNRKIAAVLAAFFIMLLPSTAVAQPVLTQPVVAQAGDDRVITVDGVGDAVLGLTPEQLAEALGADYQVGDEVRITVDFDGRVITSNDEVQFRAAMTDNTDLLTLFIVSNPQYATAEGVGPTTTIAAAEAIYGDATLAWNPDNEGREFVSFANGPGARIQFRTPGIGGNNVGVYADGDFETSDYEDGAAIAAVWVSCVSGQDCPADRAEPEPTPEPTAAPTPEPTAAPTPEPTPATTPEPTAEPTPVPGGSDGSPDDSQLPRTGATELLLVSMVAVLFVIGGAFVLMERRYLCPAWLTYRR